MKFNIPKEWCERVAKNEPPEATIPIRPYIMAELVQRAASKRYDELHGQIAAPTLAGKEGAQSSGNSGELAGVAQGVRCEVRDPRGQYLAHITANQAQNLLDYFGGESTTYVLMRCEAGDTFEEDGAPAPAGLYIYDANCPEEGVTYLGEEDEDSRPRDDDAPAERAAVPDDFDGERYCDMVDAYDEAISKGWNREQAMGCAIRAYYAALEDFAARLSQGAQGDGSYVHVVPDKCDRVVWHNQYIHLTERAAVPDGLVSAARRALAEYRKLQPKVVFDLGAFDELEAMLTAAPQPPEGARVVDSCNHNWRMQTDRAPPRDKCVECGAVRDSKTHVLLAAPTLAGKEG